jgi:hypothetical protein
VVEGHHDRAGLLERARQGRDRHLEPTQIAEHDAPIEQVAGRAGQPLALSDAGHRDRCIGHGAQAGEPGQHVGTAHAVRRQPGVALEVLQRPFGPGPEDPVDDAGVEAERAQLVLQLGDVVASQHRSPQVEQSIAEVVAGLDERRPGVLTADAVGDEPTVVLEPVHRREGLVAEASGLVLGVEADGREALVQVENALAVGTERQGQAVRRHQQGRVRSTGFDRGQRNSLSSWRS